jgi:rare lipoprotein A
MSRRSSTMCWTLWTLLACAAVGLSVPAVCVGADTGGASAPAMTGAVGETQTGLAAVYSQRLNGHKTASGQHYHADKLTASHPTLPFGTEVKVTNLKNNKSVTVRINDRGPTQPGRIIDLSSSAAHALGIRHSATAEVKIEVVKAAKA